MGHFSVQCGVTHAPITGGTDCLLVVLYESENSKDRFNHLPFGILPVVIRGNYSGYNTIEDIQETPGTKLIEKAFGMPIKQFCDLLTEMRGQSDDYGEYGRLMKPEVVAKLSKYSPLNDELMEVLGFEKHEKDEASRDYPLAVQGEEWWTHSELKNIYVRTSCSAPQDKVGSQTLWHSFRSDKIFSGPNTKDSLWSLRSGWESGREVIDLMNNLYQATGVHLAYPKGVLPLLHRMADLDYVWLHGAAFDELSKPFGKYGAKTDWWGQDSWIHGVKEEFLPMLGFEYDKKTSKIRLNDKHRYWRTYRHESSDKWIIVSDGRWSHLATVDDKSVFGNSNCSTYNMDGLLNCWKEKTGFALVVSEEEKALCTYRKNFRQAQAVVLKLEKEERQIETLSEDSFDRMASQMVYLLKGPWGREGANSFPILAFESERSRWHFMPEVFKPGVLDGSLEEELVRFAWLKSFLWKIAHPLRPMHYSGPQDGDFQALKRFAETALKIANSEIETPTPDCDY